MTANRKPFVLSPKNTPTLITPGDTMWTAPRRGVEADIGDPEDYENCVFLATDTSKIYVSNGSDWVEFGGGGGGGGDGWETVATMTYLDFIAAVSGIVADISLSNYFAVNETTLEIFVRLDSPLTRGDAAAYRINIKESTGDYADGAAVSLIGNMLVSGASVELIGRHAYANSIAVPRLSMLSTSNLVVRCDNSGGATPADLISGSITIFIRKKQF